MEYLIFTIFVVRFVGHEKFVYLLANWTDMGDFFKTFSNDDIGQQECRKSQKDVNLASLKGKVFIVCNRI